MDQQQRSLRIGAWIVAASVMLRLVSGGALEPLLQAMASPETVAVLMYLETGRVIRPYQTMSYPAESPPLPGKPQEPAEPMPKALIFTAKDLDRIEVEYDCDYEPDLQQLLTKELAWNLTGPEPRVLIIHTHSSESYTPSEGEEYEMSGDYRTQDDRYNVISIGDEVARRLEEAGIGVVHDRSYHDYPSYNGSYMDARESMERYLQEYPSVCMVLDLHRDAADTPTGQMDTSAQVDGQESAQIMIVVGTDASGLDHPNWQENLALGLKLHAQLEGDNPGLCRPLNLRSERFNGDENSGALLIEMGAAGNTRPEALQAAKALADGIIALAPGANLTENSTE